MAEYIDAFQRAVANTNAKQKPGTVKSTSSQATPTYIGGQRIGDVADKPASTGSGADSGVNVGGSTVAIDKGTGTGLATGSQYKPPAAIDENRRNAFADMKAVFESYGLGSLADSITQLMNEGYTPGDAQIKLKYSKEINPKTGKPWNDPYNIRFAGNAKRVAKGLNALDENAYLQLEDAYAQTLKSYGLSNMLSTDRAANEARFATYMENDINAPEFANRIKEATDSVINADPAVMNTFKKYYGTLTTSDLVSYFLSPNETLPKLQQKAAAAGIGAAGALQGFDTTDEATAMKYAKQGVGFDQALQGYSNLANVLPESQKLSNIYAEAGIDYSKAMGEEEFLGKSNMAQRKRKQLASLERAKFQGDAGTSSQAASLTKLYKK